MEKDWGGPNSLYFGLEEKSRKINLEFFVCLLRSYQDDNM